MPFVALLPVVALPFAAIGVLASGWLVWSSIVVGMSLLYWSAIYRFAGEPPWYALVYPLGLAMFAYIAAGAVARGRRVEWKSRQYHSR
jgi:hypothetical protein